MVCEEPCKKLKRDIATTVTVNCGVDAEVAGQENDLAKDPRYIGANTDLITSTPQLNKGRCVNTHNKRLNMLCRFVPVLFSNCHYSNNTAMAQW